MAESNEGKDAKGIDETGTGAMAPSSASPAAGETGDGLKALSFFIGLAVAATLVGATCIEVSPVPNPISALPANVQVVLNAIATAFSWFMATAMGIAVATIFHDAIMTRRRERGRE